MVEMYADSLGVDPKALLDDDKVKAVRDGRAQQQAQAAKEAQAAQTAKAASDLGNVATNGGASNAGADAINMFSGYGNPSPERIAPGT
jgi:succinyl-CoA synthetase beta subunit